MRSFCPVFERRSLSLSYHCPDRRRGRPKIDDYDQPLDLFCPLLRHSRMNSVRRSGPREPSLPLLFFWFYPSFIPLMKLLMLTLDGACCTPVLFHFSWSASWIIALAVCIFTIGVVVGGCRFLAIFNLLVWRLFA